MLSITLRSDGRPAVVVGGGGVAARKAESLAAAGFPIFVVATSIGARMRSFLDSSTATAVERPYDKDDLIGAALVVAATDDDRVNAEIVRDARAARALVCDAGRPERGDFSMPAVARAGDLTVAVDTAGASPAFSRRIARELREHLDPHHAGAARTLALMRAYVKATLPSARRSALLSALAELPVAELAAMSPSDAEHAVDEAIARQTGEPARPTRSVVCASRASALATTQTRFVAALLARRGIATTILTVTTAGDRDRSRSIDALGTTNVFVTELEAALRDGRADYAVHSCKDLPSELAADMSIAAVSAREDPRDAFCSEAYDRFEALPAGAVVGTSSPRRRLQLAALRPDLTYEDIRGNVDTRLQKLRDGRYDAIVLAMAGLNRLGIRARHTVAFDVETIVPAVAQGALAVEVRDGNDSLTAELRASVNDASAERRIACERAALRWLRAGCSAPIGIYAAEREGTMAVTGARALADGTIVRCRLERPIETPAQAAALGAELAAGLMPPAGRALALLPRTRDGRSRIAEALRASGAEVLELRAGDDWPDPAERSPDMLLFPSSGSVAAAQPYLARLRAHGWRPWIAAMGPQSRRAAAAAGFEPDAVSESASIEAFVRLVRERIGR